MLTNANLMPLAAILADAREGTFTGLIVRKIGQERLATGEKRGGRKVVYGNDLVHTNIITGFRYENLLQRSLDGLAVMDQETADWPGRDAILAAARAAKVVGYSGRGSKARKVEITRRHVDEAMIKLRHQYERRLAGEAEWSAAHVYETLEIRGAGTFEVVQDTDEVPEAETRLVRGVLVYTGERAAEEGTVYLQGLKVQETVLEPAPNGPIPAPMSSPENAVGRFIESNLPVGRFVSYRLEKGGDWILAAGGTAKLQATKAGIVFTPEVEAIIDRLHRVA